MYKIGIIGDIHIDSKVSSRKDDYFSTCLEKLEEVANNCKNIIILGDVFNRPTLTNDYFIRLYDFLRYRCTCKGNNFYTIIGNHDVYNELEDTLNKTVLGLCSATGVINIITPEQPAVIENIRFVTSYVKLKTAKEHLKNCDYNEDDVLLLHHYFEDKYEGLLYEDFLNVKCKRIFLGHEHLAFDKFKKEYPGHEETIGASMYFYKINDEYSLMYDGTDLSAVMLHEDYIDRTKKDRNEGQIKREVDGNHNNEDR